jgi:hypothetical protein
MAKPFFQLQATNIRDVKGRFAYMADKGAQKHARDLMRDIGRILVDELKEEAPVGEHYTFRGQRIQPAQRLRDSFFFRTYIRGKEIQLGVYVKPKQRKKLGWVIRGTHPFKRGRRIIRPRRAKALAFWWARKQKSMVVAYVKHPGTLPNPFHERALKKARGKIDRKQRQAARRVAEEMFMKFPQGLEVI